MQPLDDYKLLLEFDNTEKRIYDMKRKLEHPFYSKLLDKNFLKMVKPKGFSIEWNNEIDICPDDLYENSEPFDNINLFENVTLNESFAEDKKDYK